MVQVINKERITEELLAHLLGDEEPLTWFHSGALLGELKPKLVERL